MADPNKPLDGIGLAKVNEILNERLAKKADAGHEHTAADVGALPSSGGTLTGNLNGQYITGTWLKTTAATDLNKAAGRIPVLDNTGLLYYRTAAELLKDLGGAKQPVTASVTIPVTGWEADGEAGGYPYRFDLAAPGVTAKDLARVFLAPSAVAGAKACGLCPVCETMAGKIRLRAASVPTAAMAAHYWIEEGV